MNAKPTLRQQHRKESSSSVMSSCGGHTSPAKTTKEELISNHGKTWLICDAKNQDHTKDELCEKSLIFDELEDGSGRVSLPTIVVETHREKANNKLARGRKGKQGDPSCFPTTGRINSLWCCRAPQPVHACAAS